MNPKTIKIFLPEGKPTGLKIIELLGSNIQGVVIPRDSLKEALERNELNSQGVYFLIGESESGESLVYVGEAEKFSARIQSHHRQKEFWLTAVCFTAKDDNLNKTHVKYLEASLSESLKNSERVKVKEGKRSRRPGISESDEAYLYEVQEEIKFILTAIGYPFLKGAVEGEEVEQKYIFQGSGFFGVGTPTSEGFAVFSGSLLRKYETPTFQGRSAQSQRRELLQSGTIEEKDKESYELVKDVVFNSPSRAASVVAGRSVNGWTAWKTEEGKTLDEVERGEP